MAWRNPFFLGFLIIFFIYLSLFLLFATVLLYCFLLDYFFLPFPACSSWATLDITIG
jgi:hypothetical protein